MLWTALCLTPPPDAPAPSSLSPDATEAKAEDTQDALHALANWALQFTPRVALVESGAVVMELSQSVRLFGGLGALQERIQEEAPQLGVQSLAWSSNSLAALALARSAQAGQRTPATSPGLGLGSGPLSEQLDPLPLHTLSAARPHQALLGRLGCRTLGHLRALPRGGLRRRFDRDLLLALDQAYGLQPEAPTWHTLPDTFTARLDLMARVEQAPALLFGARRLLLSLCGWLEARHEGVTARRLRWRHDSLRSREAGPGGELVLRTATPTRHIEHLGRLLAEHLAHVRLATPVDGLELSALDTQPLVSGSASLLPDTAPAGESLGLVMERIAARLGAQRVLRPQPQADHRLEWMTHWHAATEAPEPATAAPARTARPVPAGNAALPQPCFVLPEPLKLPMQGPHPVYHGALRFLTGPHRVEAGWWDRGASPSTEHRHPPHDTLRSAVLGDGPQGGGAEASTRQVARDYWVALSEQAGVLWVFQERQARAEEATAWYLHGIFA
jgi:protein ImuB